MNTATLPSIFLITLLLAVGLFFFIRASVKDRTEQVKLLATEPEESLVRRLQEYFDQRAYRVTTVDSSVRQVTFQGYVRPSWFLAIFLTLLAACGIMCLSLVLSLLYPRLTSVFLGLVLLAPAAGVFYWQKAGRTEQVSLKVEELPTQEAGIHSLVTVTGHRDELTQLRQTLKLKASPEASEKAPVL
ncbi:MAG: cofactor assembly of complex C subunit B [Coleofasciculaceae cyanobacterium]